MSDATPADPAFDPYCDPAKLAHLGLMVRARLMTTPGVEKVDVEGTDLFVVTGFLLPEMCRALVATINSRAVPSTLYRGTERPGFRTSFTHHFDRDDPATMDIEAYISALLGIDDNFSEPMQGQRYQPGQEYRAHHDYFHPGLGYWQVEGPRGGQRTWTAMIFLNEPREGGETDFPLLGIKLKPKTGTLAIWNNMDASGCPNHKTLHAGTPVRKGVKHVITKWYRQDPWRLINPTDSNQL
jgi:prolyl 4-hydroxylase